MLEYLTDLKRLVKGSGWQFAGGLFAVVASTITDVICLVLLPVFLAKTLFPRDTIALSAATPGFGMTDDGSLAVFTMAVVAAFLMRGLLSVAISSLLTRLSERVRRLIGVRIADFYLTCPFEQAQERPLAHALTVINSYSAMFAGSVVSPLLRLVVDAMTVFTVLGFLLLIEPVAVMAMAPLLTALGGGYYYAVRRRAERYALAATDLQAQLAQQMGYAFSAIREARIYQLQDFFLNTMQATMRKTANANARLAAIYALPRVLGELALITLALAYMAYQNAAGVHSGVIVSHMGMLAFAGIRVLSSFSPLMSNLASVRAGRHITRILAGELQGASTSAYRRRVEPPAARTPDRVDFESLELRHVSFRYASRSVPAISNVSMTIRRGESVGIVGPSGAGKSTLSDLILGLLMPTSGQVLVNGREARLDDPGWWRTVGFVPQAVFMADDNVLRNVAYGIPDSTIDMERVTRALAMAQLRSTVDALPQGLHTRIGDLGVRLSGGQRQRIAIARALYQQRDFLVLDEATSSLDTETERDIVSAISSLYGKVTMLIIAHRESTLEGCDRIVEIRAGQIAKVRAQRG